MPLIKFHKIYYTALPMSLLYIGLVFQGCSTKTIESHWQHEIPSVDGMADDWTAASLNYEEELKLVYGIGNDNENVRFVIRFNDRRLAHKIDRRGMVIWLDKDKNRGIRYIDESARDRMWESMMEGRGGMRGNPPNVQPSLLSGKFFWVENKIETEITREKSDSYKAVASFVDGYYCLEYEFSRDLINSSEKFTAGIEIPAISDELKKMIEDRMSEMKTRRGPGGESGGMGGPGGMGGRRGSGGKMGGRRGGMGGRGMGSAQVDFDAQDIWVKVQLAKELK